MKGSRDLKVFPENQHLNTILRTKNRCRGKNKEQKESLFGEFNENGSQKADQDTQKNFPGRGNKDSLWKQSKASKRPESYSLKNPYRRKNKASNFIQSSQEGTQKSNQNTEKFFPWKWWRKSTKTPRESKKELQTSKRPENPNLKTEVGRQKGNKIQTIRPKGYPKTQSKHPEKTYPQKKEKIPTKKELQTSKRPENPNLKTEVGRQKSSKIQTIRPKGYPKTQSKHPEKTSPQKK